MVILYVTNISIEHFTKYYLYINLENIIDDSE